MDADNNNTLLLLSQQQAANLLTYDRTSDGLRQATALERKQRAEQRNMACTSARLTPWETKQLVKERLSIFTPDVKHLIIPLGS